MDLVFELPAQRSARLPLCQPEQQSPVHFQAARPYLVDVCEELRANAVILLADRQRIADGSYCPIGLEARLDRRAEGDARLPGIEEIDMPVRPGAEILFNKQIDRVNRVKDFLAQRRPKRRLARVAVDKSLAVFPEPADIEPILPRLGKDELVFR